MRNLGDWLGHIVVIVGNVSVLENHRFCIDNVRITQYSDAPEIRKVDHLWVYLTPEEMESCAEAKIKCPRFALKEGRDVGFVGNVIQYTRKNGSRDYAVKSNGHAARALVPPSGKYSDISLLPAQVRLDYLLELFQSLKRRLAWFNFERVTYSQFVEEVKDAIAHVRLELEVEEFSKAKAKESLKHRKGDITPDPIKFKSKQLTHVKGFS
jgi:hypothetical protein